MKKVSCLCVCLCFASLLVFAGEPITIGETIQIKSKVMGEERTILVSTPPGYDQGSQDYPVLYMTDGGQHLTHTRGTVDFLAGNGIMPQVIIVGVNNTDRTRDLTPTNAVMTMDDGTEREFPTSGGAAKFLDFFEDELFPFIDENYRTSPYRIFSGHSFGGLFALNAFFSQPDMFQATLAISPSLGWDDELSLRQAKTFVGDRLRQSGTIYVAMGDEEEGEPRPNLLDRLESEFEKVKTDGFEYEVRRLPDENHGSVVLRAQYWGLRFVFEPWGLPRDAGTGRFNGGLEGLKKHYAALSKRYGFTVVPPELQVNAIGYQYLMGENVEAAIQVFGYNTELYPESANVYDSYAEALEAAGRNDEALANYAQAVRTAEKIGDARLGLFEANLDRFIEEHDSLIKE